MVRAVATGNGSSSCTSSPSKQDEHERPCLDALNRDRLANILLTELVIRADTERHATDAPIAKAQVRGHGAVPVDTGHHG